MSVDTLLEEARSPISENFQVLNRKELAEKLHTTVKTLEYWQQMGVGPHFTRPPGTRGFYLLADVLEWMSGGDK